MSPTRCLFWKIESFESSKTLKGSMFAHHFDRREHMSEPKLQLQPYGVPLTTVTLMRRTSKLDIVPPHKETLDHPKPFI
ncbi:hypothetical protein HOLleu_30975 [Holothuria leucospilota]|uniref:Uncharacterized protein n=1 Tax=Holothuria leucospilota TaxID=206669 RepID=A0A9Q1BLF9_HOLLE|nr:hypothetical protein HOLleu_30975 [Holothuria leucospilota]